MSQDFCLTGFLSDTHLTQKIVSSAQIASESDSPKLKKYAKTDAQRPMPTFCVSQSVSQITRTNQSDPDPESDPAVVTQVKYSGTSYKGAGVPCAATAPDTRVPLPKSAESVLV